jgi:hypothetical protein
MGIVMSLSDFISNALVGIGTAATVIAGTHISPAAKTIVGKFNANEISTSPGDFAHVLFGARGVGSGL